VTTPFSHSKTEFYLTTATECPYLPGRQERKIFSFLGGPDAQMINSALSKRGFRRSQNILYLPACEMCNACRPVRVKADEYQPSRSRKKILKRNHDVTRIIKPAKATAEQFSVLRAYLDSRHKDGGMSDMTVLDYTSMVEQTAVETSLIEYWLDHGTEEAKLIGCSLTDHLDDGLSMVYSFFDPDYKRRSLGTLMILDHIEMVKEFSLPHLYLGYWVRGSRKMSYKADFQPAEILTSRGWRQMLPSELNPPMRRPAADS